MSTKRSGQIICAVCKRATCKCLGKGPRKWLIRAYVGRTASGTREYVARLVHGGRKAADAALAELLTEKTAGTLRARSAGTVDDWLTEWITTIAGPSTRPQTRAAYAEVLDRYVRPHIGRLRLDRLREGDVRSMLVKLRDRGLAPRTVRMAREVLRNALEQAVAAGHITSNPAKGKTIAKALPAKAHQERPTIPSDRVADFLEVIRSTPMEGYWLVLLFGGLRPGEALGLRWRDVRGNVLRVQQVLSWRQGSAPRFDAPKTEQSRRAVPVPAFVTATLGEHRRAQAAVRLAAGPDWQDHDLVFCDARGGPLRQEPLRAEFKRILEAADLPAMRPYDLRHTSASLLLERGLSLKVVSERLGHSTITLTSDTYSHVSEGMQQQAADALAEFGR